jgi:hypothetical protein
MTTDSSQNPPRTPFRQQVFNANINNSIRRVQNEEYLTRHNNRNVASDGTLVRRLDFDDESHQRHNQNRTQISKEELEINREYDIQLLAAMKKSEDTIEKAREKETRERNKLWKKKEDSLRQYHVKLEKEEQSKELEATWNRLVEILENPLAKAVTRHMREIQAYPLDIAQLSLNDLRYLYIKDITIDDESLEENQVMRVTNVLYRQLQVLKKEQESSLIHAHTQDTTQ